MSTRWLGNIIGMLKVNRAKDTKKISSFYSGKNTFYIKIKSNSYKT